MITELNGRLIAGPATGPAHELAREFPANRPGESHFVTATMIVEANRLTAQAERERRLASALAERIRTLELDRREALQSAEGHRLAAESILLGPERSRRFRDLEGRS